MNKTTIKNEGKQKNKINNIKINFKTNLNVFYLMRLIAKHYIKSGTVIFTDFILPIIIMSISFNVLNKHFSNSVLPGMILTPIITSGFISFATSYNEWRNSIILKKIRVSRISISELFISFLIFYSFISILTFLFGLFYVFILWKLGLDSLQDFGKIMEKVNWGIGSLAILQLILICISGGFLISTFSKKITGILAIGLMLFLVQAFILGCYFALDLVLKKKEMRVFSYFLPFYAPIRIFQYNWFDSGEVQETFYTWGKNGERLKEKMAMVKNWKLSYVHDVDFKTLPLNFHDSYWSLFLVGGGWFMFFSGYSIYKNKNLKFA